MKPTENIEERMENIVSSMSALADAVSASKLTVDEYISVLYNNREINPESHEKCENAKRTLARYVFLRQFFFDREIKVDTRYGDWLREITRDKEKEEF